jgi:hypothetical protein
VRLACALAEPGAPEAEAEAERSPEELEETQGESEALPRALELLLPVTEGLCRAELLPRLLGEELLLPLLLLLTEPVAQALGSPDTEAALLAELLRQAEAELKLLALPEALPPSWLLLLAVALPVPSPALPPSIPQAPLQEMEALLLSLREAEPVLLRGALPEGLGEAERLPDWELERDSEELPLALLAVALALPSSDLEAVGELLPLPMPELLLSWPREALQQGEGLSELLRLPEPLALLLPLVDWLPQALRVREELLQPVAEEETEPETEPTPPAAAPKEGEADLLKLLLLDCSGAEGEEEEHRLALLLLLKQAEPEELTLAEELSTLLWLALGETLLLTLLLPLPLALPLGRAELLLQALALEEALAPALEGEGVAQEDTELLAQLL